jgi:hypothetical protein
LSLKPITYFNNLPADFETSSHTNRQGIPHSLQEGLQDDKTENPEYPQSIPEYVGKLVRDFTYRGQRQIQIIDCKYSTDGNMQTIIDHIYDIYEPLKLELQTHGTLRAYIKIIPIVIIRTGTFHVKTLAEIAQLVSFKEEPPDKLTFKQLPNTAKIIAMALHVHAHEWLTHISKISRKNLTTKTKQATSTKN